MHTPETPIRPIIPTSGPEAFRAVAPELARLSDDELRPISVHIPFAHQIAVAAADRIDTLIPELRELPHFDMANVYRLRLYAAACQHAHLLASNPERADPRMPELLAEASKLREDLLSTAELLVRFELVSGARVAAIRAGTGYVDMANDLQQLGVLYTELWEQVVGRVPVTRAMVDRAPVLAHQLHVALGVRRLDGAVAATHEPQRLRARAFTLFARAYGQCRRAVEFLRYDFGDADRFAPSIYAKPRRRAANGGADADRVNADLVAETVEGVGGAEGTADGGPASTDAASGSPGLF